ncbi:MAG: hypothetical protein PHF37_00660 [Phycisphaerae bacterium]|nr:hypothetical protein [Phycisphaerae bacterium]
MKTSFALPALFFVVTLAFTGICGQILSGSFEEDPNMMWYPNGPWDASGGTPEILQTYTHARSNPQVTINAVDGQNFVMLKTGGRTETTYYSQLTQVIDVNAGESITGVYFFATDDWLPVWNDFATIKLIPADPCSGLTEILLAYKDVNSVGSYNSMENWGRFSHAFDSNEAGTYVLTLRVEDVSDYKISSYLAVDALKIIEGPPEPWCTYKLAGDINNDCKVDFFDFAKMQENWLIDCGAMPEDEACVPR